MGVRDARPTRVGRVTIAAMPRPEHAAGDSTIDVDPNGATEIVDEMHEQADHLGDLSRDPDDDEEVWFEAEALAAASTVELGAGDRLARSPVFDHLVAAIATPGISLARLPGWPGASAAGQGLGAIADDLVGELRPGDLVLLSSSKRGVGRTSLLAQLADGLALASDSARPLTPVLCVVEGPPALWRARSLARFCDVDARIFIEAQRARREPRLADLLDEYRHSPWASLDEYQRFVGRDALVDPERRSSMVSGLRRWQRELGEDSHVVWPVVVVDPLEQLAGHAGVADMLGMLASLAAAEELIVLASCDLDDADAARARALDGHATVHLRAMPGEDRNLELETCHRRLGPRGRGQLHWHRPSGRFSNWG
jgi:hypothetical protein